jgi:AcrR family transcriptional regulator
VTPGGGESARRPGRPRDAQADDAILDAAVEVLAEQGPGRFTVDAVATRAGVGKATIYRRWASRGALLLDTAHHRMAIEVEDPDTGSLTEDIVATLTGLGVKARDTVAGRILPVIMSEAVVNPEMRRILTAFVADRRRLPRAIVERGIARGELPDSTDPDLLLDILAGTVFFRVLLSDAPVDEAIVREVVDIVLAGCRAAGDRAGSPAGPS